MEIGVFFGPRWCIIRTGLMYASQGGTMNETTSDRAEVVAAFDVARDRFLAAFTEVPDEALTYLPDGDEFAIGALLLHVAQPLRDYTRLLGEMAASDGRLDQGRDLVQQEAQLQQRLAIIAARPTAAERAPLLASLEAAHQQFRARLLATSPADFDREIEVIYPGSTEPYPTSPRMVAGWVIDHYDEHVPQVAALLVGWRATNPDDF
jgi:hypothetical protein